MNRFSVFLSTIILLTPLVAGSAGFAAERAGLPNIVFIMVDDAGLGDFSAYGSKYSFTPNVDRLAEEGMKFTRAYSGSALGGPSRCALMTGQHSGHGLIRSEGTATPLPLGQLTVAAMLQKAGYVTGGFGTWGLGNPGSTGVPERQGFDVFYGYYDQRQAHEYYPDVLIRNSVNEAIRGNEGGQKAAYSHHLIANETIKFIEDNKSRPFFCYAGWTPPHGPYVIPSDAPFTDKPWPQSVKNYAAMVTMVDKDIGRIIQKLYELELTGNTLVVFTSCNGANRNFIRLLNSTGGLRGYKRLLYEGGIRTPFIVRWPGKVPAGTTSDILTSHVDFLPTVADMLGMYAPRGTDGVSILPTLLGNAQVHNNDYLYHEIYEPYFQQSLTMAKWKGYRLGTEATLELYDLKADAQEKIDVAAANPEIVKRIEAIMAREHTPSPLWSAPKMPLPQSEQGGSTTKSLKKKGGQNDESAED